MYLSVSVHLFLAVFEILLAYLRLGDWKEAFLEVIPQRKVATQATSPSHPPSLEQTRPETSSVDTEKAVVTDSQHRDKGEADLSSERGPESVSSSTAITESGPARAET